MRSFQVKTTCYMKQTPRTQPSLNNFLIQKLMSRNDHRLPHHGLNHWKNVSCHSYHNCNLNINFPSMVLTRENWKNIGREKKRLFEILAKERRRLFEILALFRWNIFLTKLRQTFKYIATAFLPSSPSFPQLNLSFNANYITFLSENPYQRWW